MIKYALTGDVLVFREVGSGIETCLVTEKFSLDLDAFLTCGLWVAL